jgi:membrane-bound serine protease (ClpP class)
MDILLNPNVAYLFLAGGLILAVLSLLAPGTGILEIFALFALLLAGWAVYNLPINEWALLVLLAGVVVFILAIRKPRAVILLVVAIVMLVLGSAFLFNSDNDVWWKPAVNPLLAATVSILSAGFFWVATQKVIQARSVRPTHDLSALDGAIGEARSDIHEEGSVQVAGELWSARSQQPIPNGARVRVAGREGFILIVEAIDQPDSHA